MSTLWEELIYLGTPPEETEENEDPENEEEELCQ